MIENGVASEYSFRETTMSDFKVVLPRTTEEWQRDMNIVYQQSRADVIEEYKEQLLENLILLKDKYFDFAKKSTMPETYTHIKRMDTVNIIIEMVKIKAEQLKE